VGFFKWVATAGDHYAVIAAVDGANIDADADDYGVITADDDDGANIDADADDYGVITADDDDDDYGVITADDDDDDHLMELSLLLLMELS
jgi:hypothetical protein